MVLIGMVLNVTLWYSMMLDAIAWYSMKLIDVPKKYPKVPMSTPPKKVPKSTQKYQKSQKVPTDYLKVHRSTEKYLKEPKST